MFDKNAQQLPGLPKNGDSIAKWAADNGGVPASGNYVAITPHALNGHRVTVKQNPEGITVDVKSRTDPPHAYPYLTGGCGGFLPYRFDLNLDAEPVTVTAKPDEEVLTNTVPRLVALPHDIGSDETEVWNLVAVTQRALANGPQRFIGLRTMARAAPHRSMTTESPSGLLPRPKPQGWISLATRVGEDQVTALSLGRSPIHAGGGEHGVVPDSE